MLMISTHVIMRTEVAIAKHREPQLLIVDKSHRARLFDNIAGRRLDLAQTIELREGVFHKLPRNVEQAIEGINNRRAITLAILGHLPNELFRVL